MKTQKNIEQFYNELRNQFPEIEKLTTWEKYDWSMNGYNHSYIMTEIAQEVAIWIAENKFKDTQKLLNVIESTLNDGDTKVTSFICTDFLVTIMEAKKGIREVIKRMMKPETLKSYNDLLEMYRELD